MHLFVHIEHQAMPWRLRRCQGAARENSSFGSKGWFPTRSNRWRLTRKLTGSDQARTVGPKGERRAPREGGGSLMPACSGPALRRTSVRLPGGVCNRSADTGLRYPHSNYSTTVACGLFRCPRVQRPLPAGTPIVWQKERKRPELNSGLLVPRCATVLLTERRPPRR
jgi:hypothetical protein